jgi:hypothetical protein
VARADEAASTAATARLPALGLLLTVNFFSLAPHNTSIRKNDWHGDDSEGIQAEKDEQGTIDRLSRRRGRGGRWYTFHASVLIFLIFYV